ncbi:UvrD-helicase domain-containing protein [Nocardia puris]|uniref:UvrD-helicase domain-containing protein n=1 Tax=Nocardia puris TaxID=208602 RepID=UPI00189356DB|nr:UvrD-helicase domain-containing protein [Nocardia puris]MBF6210417.1 UvrD-helicase domain-containing protein [Nocardia puris]MBF6367492.1 UvrD-helicase domain-containing protein [Nocardia puris]MBF6457677.1 UvrD-helicase domain-containing protein [Nocardia puris]
MTVDNALAFTSDTGDRFDPYGPLPTGTTVLEASAGTGKTHAIVGLAVRYVAEAGVGIDELLLVTFSRAATQELRERARDRFVAVAAALADPEAAAGHADDLVRHLARAEADEVGLRRARLVAALADFDAGTIATTHSFCQRMLDELGLAGEHDPAARLVESVDEVVRTVADDLYLRRYARGEPPFRTKDAHALALAAVQDRHARLVPDDGGEAGERVAFATAARAETERRKRLAGLRDFDDLLVLLHDVLADPEHGPRARARIRERYRVALVDEFQDTDPLQWNILRHAFHGHATLVLVGDPKQAIYAFRGAEVLSYLDAVAHADRRRELTVNWRSDAGLLAALDHVQGGAALGHPEITVYPVAATRGWSRLSGPADLTTPLRLRCLPRSGAGPLNRSGFPTVGRQRARVADDLAADIVRVLESDVRLDVSSAKAGAGESVHRPVDPGDIAVLVRTRTQIDVVRAALDRAGIASVLAGGVSVFGTPAATDWLWVLRALEQPHRSDRVRLAACTPILGRTAAEIDSGGADLVGRVSAQLRDAARLFARAGFAAVFEKLSAEADLARRLLSVENGERELTDLRHVAQLLDQVAAAEGLGLTALTRWLGDQIRDPAAGTAGDRSRRLDRDAAAVQIATVHASKGLEFPLVYLPFAWDNAKNPYPATLLFHDDDGARVLDVGGPEAPGYQQRKNRCEAEEAGEELRLLYVALTRAMCQVVAWWAPSASTPAAPLHRMIFGRREGGTQVPARAQVPADKAVVDTLTTWASGAAEAISVTAVSAADDVRAKRARPEPFGGALAAARFDRVLDHQWRRTSYSALTAGAHEMPTETEPEDERGPGDEPAAPPVDTADPVEAAAPSLMNGLPYGAEFGTLVHGVLERIDTDAADLETEVHTRCREAVEEVMSEMDPAVLGVALLAVLRTPLGFGALADIATRDRLCELEFELPLAGGDTPSGRAATLRAIAELVRAHLPATDDLAPYADQLAALDDVHLRGYLTGSIDAVLRVTDPRGTPRFVVVDYKTNSLGTGELTVEHYTRDRMTAEMMRSHYPLQALLYSVALHRYLRWRLPGYDPARHLGGCRYLFVRGMIGPGTPSGRGVFDWQPPAGLVVALSDLLAGEV